MVGIAFYDVDKLYDTIPSRFYDDSDYTPNGKYKWDSERYKRKIENIAQVVDSLRMPIVALYGVENEQVVRDLTAITKEEYAYVHNTQDFSNGLDFALLYYGDIFFPKKSTTHLNAVCIEGYLRDEKIAIIINNNTTSLGVLLSKCNLDATSQAIIILGRQETETTSRWGFSDKTINAERQGRGTAVYGDKWQMRHRIATNINNIYRCDIFVKRWLLDERGVPKSTFERTKYRGGYSSSLPIFIYFDKMLEF